MIKAVIFDKDGTLLEFSDLWIRACFKIFEKLDLNLKQVDLVKKDIGIDTNGRVVENSVLAAGTISDLANILRKYIHRDGIEEFIQDSFIQTIDDDTSQVRTTCDLIKVFDFLKNQSIKIIVSTSDNLKVAEKMFDILGLAGYIDFIISADHFVAKPDPSSLDFIMDKYALSSNELIMVGDSRVDMEYGNHLRASIGVLCGTGTYQMLEKYANKVIESPLELIDLIKII